MLVITVVDGKVKLVYRCVAFYGHKMLVEDKDYQVVEIAAQTDWLKPEVYKPDEENKDA